MHQYLASFRNWLQNKNYSESTVRNYVVDLNKYFDFVINSEALNPSTDIFEKDFVAAYINSIGSDTNKERYTSSLTKFFSFCVDQKITDHNPLLVIKNPQAKTEAQDLESLIRQYEEYLTRKNFSPATVKNYLNDIRQFISWASTSSDGVK